MTTTSTQKKPTSQSRANNKIYILKYEEYYFPSLIFGGTCILRLLSIKYYLSGFPEKLIYQAIEQVNTCY